MNRRDFLKAAGAGAASLWMGGLQGCFMGKGTKPNIIYINVDDLGWKDCGFMGSGFYETPRLDGFARQGVVFTNAYAPAANCAPSRASCLTGQYAPRHGIYTVNSSARGDSRTRKLIPVTNRTALPAEQVTIAENLRDNGFVTAHIGKWHLGDNPLAQGFDLNIGGCHLGQPPGYFSPYGIPFLEDGPEGEYLTDRLTDEAIRFVVGNRSRPFFLYLAYYAVHTPLQPKPEKVSKYENKAGSGGQNSAALASMIESLDENIGRLLNVLDELKLAGKTVVVFTSDNGGVKRLTSMAPLRAGKGSYYEGGIRVPLVIRWPQKNPEGLICDAPVGGIDFYPTFLEMTRTEAAEGKILDGRSLVPILTRTGTVEERPLFWHFPVYLEGGDDGSRDSVFRTRPGSAVRLGDWKLLEYFEDGGLELYNLSEDIGERNNLISKFPKKAAELRRELDSWRRNLQAPVPHDLNPDYDADYDMSLRLSRRSGLP